MLLLADFVLVRRSFSEFEMLRSLEMLLRNMFGSTTSCDYV